MESGDAAEGHSIATALAALDETDTALRVLYRELAHDPDRADEREEERARLHESRLSLAQSVGLALLARHRAAAAASDTLPAAPPSTPSAPAPADCAPRAPSVPDSSQPSATESDGTPPADRASDADLAAWKDSVRARGLGAGLRLAPSDATAWPLVLHQIMETVGPPRNIDASVEAIEEVEALDAVATDELRDLWARLPRHGQQVWLSMLVARTRALRESSSAPRDTIDRAKIVVARYPAWAKKHVPGHVNGLQLKHAPLRGSWAQDGRDHWDALCQLLGEEGGVAPSRVAPRKKPVRSDHEHNDDGSDLDPKWRLLPLVRGLKAIVVGGDPREPNRQRLERALGLASLEWPPIDGPRKVDAIVGRIRKGTYGLVIVLQAFVAHVESEPVIEAAKSAGTPWALTDGYGVASVKLGLERFLGGPRGGPLRIEEDRPADASPDRHSLGGHPRA